ncbi:hypothetical protein MRX96_032193 [Rhipicephalus microplus]
MDNAASVKAFFPFGARPRSGTSRLLADEARRFLLGTALRARRGPASLAIWFHAVLESQARWIICLGVPASSAAPVAFAFALAWLCGLHASRFCVIIFRCCPLYFLPFARLLFHSWRSLSAAFVRGVWNLRRGAPRSVLRRNAFPGTDAPVVATAFPHRPTIHRVLPAGQAAFSPAAGGVKRPKIAKGHAVVRCATTHLNAVGEA